MNIESYYFFLSSEKCQKLVLVLKVDSEEFVGILFSYSFIYILPDLNQFSFFPMYVDIFLFDFPVWLFRIRQH